MGELIKLISRSTKNKVNVNMMSIYLEDPEDLALN